MKRYTLKLIIEEGHDEFWDDINKRQVTGCEEVKEMIDEALFAIGIDNHNSTVILERYEDSDV